MTMAKVENGSITQVGLPAELRSQPMSVLKAAGWKKIVGTAKPTDETQPGYRWEYGAEWLEEDGAVYGTWIEAQMPQPYPSWSWVDGEGWVAPVPQPDGDYYWDEDAGEWVEEDNPVNVNTADFDTLRDLNGVDEVRAQAIIDGRPWTDVNDLTTIQGISQEMVDSWEITA